MRTALILASLLWLAACGEPGNEVFATDTREVSSFSGVENRSSANVYIRVDPTITSGEVRLTLSGDENLIEDVDTWVEGGWLYVDTDHHLWPHFELKVDATVPALEDATNEGSGDIEVTGMNGEYAGLALLGSGDLRASGDLTNVSVDSSGSGNAYLSGTTDRIDVMSSGSGDVHGLGMQARLADVHASGSGKVEVCVTGRLEAYVSGSGDIEYGCHPDTVLPHDSGSGDIRPD
jgi:hypothetical protein